MKVAYIVAEFPSATETFISRELEALYDSGVDVQVFSLKNLRKEKVICPRDRTFDWVRYSPYPVSITSLAIHLSGFFSGFMGYMGQLFRLLFKKSGYGPLAFGRKFLLFHRGRALAHFPR